KYFPYWPIFLLLITFTVTSAWFYLRFRLPIYQSSATLLIKDQKKGMEESKVLESLNPLSSKKIIENEMEVIRSRDLMKEVVEKLALYASIYKPGKWIDTPAYILSPVLIQLKKPEFLTEVERVDFSFDASMQKVKLNGQLYDLGQWVATPYGELKFVKNKHATHNTASLYFTLTRPRKVVQSLLGNLKIEPAGKLSTVVYLSFRDNVPERSEDILNTLISSYEKASINDKVSLAESTLNFLDERLSYIANDLDSIERALQYYKSRKGAIDLSSQSKLFLQNVSDNDQKLSDVNMKLAVLSQVEQYVTSNNSRGGLVPSTLGINDPLLTSLLEKLYNTELQYEKLKITTGQNNPELSTLFDQIHKIKPSILENVRSQRRSLEASKTNLYTTNNAYGKMLSALPQQERDLI
ncbi:MAG: capsular biosynthesis protein, partial [Flavobacterium sp.]